MQHILKTYQRRLINLSSSNKSLLLLRPSAALHLDLHALGFLHKEGAFGLLKKLLARQATVPLCSVADSRHAPENVLSRHLKNISRKARLILEERGAKELFVGWPFVHGRFQDGTPVRCPLLFFPVELLVEKQQWSLRPLEAMSPQLNRSFLLAYAHYQQLPLQESLLETDFSSFPKDALAFRTALYELLKEQGLDLNFNRELFTDEVIPFRSQNRHDFEAQWQPGQLKLQPEAVLGIFPQAGSYLLNDYEELMANPALQTFEDLFQEAGKLPQKITEQNFFTLFELDAAQEAALQQVRGGQSVVVQGPPGTGKSQLICNLAADFMARGKKVLVVSQKRAALDVVYKRLQAKQLQNFVALVHDVNTDRKHVFGQLNKQIEQVEAYKRQNLALDNIYAERQFSQCNKQIQQITRELDEFRAALFDTSYCGWSVKELYLNSRLAAPHLPPQPLLRQFTAENLPAFEKLAEPYWHAAAIYQRPSFSWRNRRSFHAWSWPERQQLEESLKRVPEMLQKWAGFPFLNRKKQDFAFWLAFAGKQVFWMNFRKTLQKRAVFPALQQLWQSGLQPARLARLLRQLQAVFENPAGLESSLTLPELQALKQTLARLEENRFTALEKLQWNLFSKEKQRLKNLLDRYRLPYNAAGFAQLRQKMLLREEAEQLLAELRAGQAGIPVLGTDAPEKALEILNLWQLAAKLLKDWKTQKFLRLHPENLTEAHFLQVLAAAEALSAEIKTEYEAWLEWLLPEQVEQVAADEAFRQDLLLALPQHFEALVAFDRLQQQLRPEQIKLLDAVAELAEGTAQQLLALRNSIFLAWIQHIEQQRPVLQAATNGRIRQLEKHLAELLQQKQQLSHEMVLTRLREQTYAGLERNRLGNPVTYRRLQAQVSKKRQLYPLRKLTATFPDEIFALVPCWLASPETVSAVFPLNRFFDLVIFDEASQCFAEQGIPAICRAAQTVIAGDQQQLGPSDLYQARWQQEAEDDPEELVVESLLQLGSLYLPQAMLTEHYRSRYPELIAFSNRHFYEQKLRLIPYREDLNKPHRSLEFIKVNGLWQQNCNRPEAEQVVALVFELLGQGQADIGVVTFNYAQQVLVQDMLENAAAERNVTLPASVFVKNIENIQGDEKHVIIFSVGYAPDAAGKISAQFGSLNAAKGANRLNVAVTRAKDKIYVVSSLYADQLQVAQTLHEGPKLLKAYLHFAQHVSERGYAFELQQPAKQEQPYLLKHRLLELRPQQQLLTEELPFADLTLKSRSSYEGLICTDDDLYYSSPSVKHAHALLPQRLQERQWPQQRVWSRQYWLEPERLLQQVTSFSDAEI